MQGPDDLELSRRDFLVLGAVSAYLITLDKLLDQMPELA
jgi:hypothetical protein